MMRAILLFLSLLLVNCVNTYFIFCPINPTYHNLSLISASFGWAVLIISTFIFLKEKLWR